TSVVDLDSMRVLAELPLPGRPRWAAYDSERDIVYANVQEPAQIVVVDCERAVIQRALPVTSAGPHGLWLDAGRLFCAADGGAHTIGWDGEGGCLYVFCPESGRAALYEERA